MSTTTTNGYILPATGEKTWWANLIYNWKRISAHSHNGIDSNQLDPNYFTKHTQALAATDWTAVSGQAGTYKQSVVMPANTLFDNVFIKAQIASGTDIGVECHPSIVKTGDSAFDIYVNDNTLALTITYV